MTTIESTSLKFPLIKKAAAIAGAVLLAGGAVTLAAHPVQFFRSYLFAFFFWTALTLGCLGILLLHHLILLGLDRALLETKTKSSVNILHVFNFKFFILLTIIYAIVRHIY